MKHRYFKKLSRSGWLCAWTSEKDFDNWMNQKTSFFLDLGYFKVSYEVSQYYLCYDQKFFDYDNNIDDSLLHVDGCQVFFNPKKSLKLKNFYKILQ